MCDEAGQSAILLSSRPESCSRFGSTAYRNGVAPLVGKPRVW